MLDLPYAFGGPVGTGRLRAEPEHFRVRELPVCEPDGAGEHVWLWIRKRCANTEWVARQLARVAAVRPADVSYAGLKDRHAVTEQWFSVQLPGKAAPDWTLQPIEGVEILRAERHSRKLKRGALRGNHFEIRISEYSGDRVQLEQRLQTVAARGVPNYFGEQRFGRDQQNLPAARAELQNVRSRRLPRHTRSLYLSALRSHLFNRVAAARVTDASWDACRAGDILQLEGSRACFNAAPDDAALPARLAALEIHPTGPLWGRGEPAAGAAVGEFERRLLAAHVEDCRILEAAGLEQARRALRVRAAGLVWQWCDAATLDLCFELPAGSYATVLLRELIMTVDPAGEVE